MPLRLVELPFLDGIRVREPVGGGVTWADGRLHRLERGRVAWSIAVDRPPRASRHERRLYVGVGARVFCLDSLDGRGVWSAPVDDEPVAVRAHAEGVDVLTARTWFGFNPSGLVRYREPAPDGARFLGQHAGTWTIAGPRGAWRCSPTAAPMRLTHRPCVALVERSRGTVMLVDDASGSAVVEHDGTPLVWPFPDVATHAWAPAGEDGWIVSPRGGRAGLWWFDRRVQVRKRSSLPECARQLVAFGETTVVLLADGMGLALIQEGVSEPLLLPFPDVEAISVLDGNLYLALESGTRVLALREA